MSPCLFQSNSIMYAMALKGTNMQHSGHEGQIIKTEKTIEMQLVRYVVRYKVLLSNVIDADHQNSCLFTNKGHFSPPLWVLIGVLARFHE